MFEVRDYIGPWRSGGITSYPDAVAAAKDRCRETGQPCIVNEITLRIVIKKEDAK